MYDLSGERLLYVPNEATIGEQAGPRATFEELSRTGQLKAYSAYSLHVETREHGLQGALRDLRTRVLDFEPTLVLWQHPGALAIPVSWLKGLRSTGAFLIYHEGDAYGLVRKRLPHGARSLARSSHVAFTAAMGANAALLKRFGAAQVGYAPSSVDLTRFGTPWNPTSRREFDVVVIGNRVTSSGLPLTAFPGARHRERLFRGLGSLLGDRLAIYGRGWDGFVGARGPIDFDLQEQAARQAWLTASWDHFDRVPYSFSNRLPISLAAGVAHITSYHAGYEHLFTDGVELFLADSVRGFVDRVGDLLSGSRDVLNAVAVRGAVLARTHLSDQVVYPRLLKMAAAFRDGGALPPASQWTQSEAPHL